MIKLNFNKADGLIPVIVQDYKTLKVLMLAYMNEESFALTNETKIAHYWSRSRKSLWKKGETSGNLQEVKELIIDCDEDTILLKVNQVGSVACHTGHESCFYRNLEDGKLKENSKVLVDPEKLYSK